ncbi:hypothetical protein [Peptoniphilus stercorisuis]|uniref:DsrE/DsrF-like family n=1 Tax=Peptoniphilus stercorisuis TaxID=1436965 RepID=A0ABS4KD04_9FIRM|nr:hypothetical protein [Peptoniphilus stercorisuis]MBP2025661.1 hypothetical protein [Peptoniphilus stercorisuis]
MKKYLFYAMKGEKMCFAHLLMNAIDLHEAGNEVKIIFEGQAVKLPKELIEEDNPLYKKAVENNLIAGICLACSKMLEVYDFNKDLPYPLLSDMMNHAGMKPFIEKGYEVIVM